MICCPAPEPPVLCAEARKQDQGRHQDHRGGQVHSSGQQVHTLDYCTGQSAPLRQVNAAGRPAQTGLSLRAVTTTVPWQASSQLS